MPWQSFDKQKLLTEFLNYLYVLQCRIFRRKVTDKTASIMNFENLNFERILLYSNLLPHKMMYNK